MIRIYFFYANNELNLGLGGVGGYFGGLLAKAYAESDQLKLYLLLAVKRKKQLQSQD
jgi:ketopantoate reductase